MSRFQHTFKAQCVTDVDKDEVLATAYVVFAGEHEIVRAAAQRMGTVVFVTVTFKAVAETGEDQAHIITLARRAAESLSHRWPTDTVSIDGKTPKYHERREAILQAAKDSGHLIISEVK